MCIRDSIMSLHDLHQIEKHCTHTLALLGNGDVVSGETGDVLGDASVRRTFYV